MEAQRQRKRMRSGDRPGLQNRRAAGFPSPVGSTPTRFRHIVGYPGSAHPPEKNPAPALLRLRRAAQAKYPRVPRSSFAWAGISAVPHNSCGDRPEPRNLKKYGSEVPTLAKNARMGRPQSWWCPQKQKTKVGHPPQVIVIVTPPGGETVSPVTATVDVQ